MNYVEACQRLGLPSEEALSESDLKKAFKKAAMRHHPDKNLDKVEAAKEAFQQVSQAFDFLTKCIARGRTGPNQPRWKDDHPMFDDHDHGYHYYSYGEEEEEYYEEYDDNYVDLHDILFSMFFAKMASGGGGRGGMSQHAPGVSFSFGGVPMGTNFSTAGTGRAGTFGGGRAGTFGGGGYRDKDRPFQSAGNGSHYPRKYGSEECDEDGNDDDAFDEMYQRMFEQQLRREEQREQERKKRKEHAAYMAERARKAHEEGRDFFESWNIKQLTGECQRRGIPTKGKQQSDIVELLINDEAEKRLRDQLKKEAPLLDEWAELIEMKNPDMNGLKVRVIDFFDDKYTVEWDVNAGKKGKKGYLRESRKARVKSENLRLWGTGAPSETTTASISSDKENQKSKKKKSKTKSGKKATSTPTGKPARDKPAEESKDAPTSSGPEEMSVEVDKAEITPTKPSDESKTTTTSNGKDKATSVPMDKSPSKATSRKKDATMFTIPSGDSGTTTTSSSAKRKAESSGGKVVSAPTDESSSKPESGKEYVAAESKTTSNDRATKESTSAASITPEAKPTTSSSNLEKAPANGGTTESSTASAEGGKSVGATESAPSETKLCCICGKEHDMNMGTHVVLSCAHVYCKSCCNQTFLPDPTSEVEVRACRICGKADPGVDGVKSLPYVVDLLDPPESLVNSIYAEYSAIRIYNNVEAMEKIFQGELDTLKREKTMRVKLNKDEINSRFTSKKEREEKNGKLIKQMLASVEAEFGPKRKGILARQQSTLQTIATGRSLKDLEKKRDESISEATKGINKHYRRASVKVHPDRFGDTYKKEFDALIKARDSLLDVELRHKYLEQMLEVLCKVGTRWMKQAHDSFVQKNLNPKSTDTEPGTKQQPLQIEGGLMYTTPKKPVVAILKASERKIRVSLRIPAGLAYEFRRHCQSVRIVGSRADLTTDKAFAKTFTKEHFYSNMDDFIMECDLTLPDAGVWDLRWSYTVESEPGNPHTSECSVDTRVDLVSPKTQAKINLMKSFEKSAIRRTSEIRAAIQKLGKITGSHTDIRKKYSTLQEAILKGRHIEFHLEKSMRQAGVDTASMTTPLYALREVLHRTLPYKTELDKSLAAFEKKAAYKSFKTDIYDILESGDASTWIATVSNECLQKDMKGDANRLYQLLMEGKKAYSLELVDADTLFAAAERKDLFTAKQLQDLLKRADEMEGVAAQEAFRLAAEEEKRCQEDAKIQNMKERAGSMELDRGCLVRIEGIKNEPSLNGILVTYMGLGEGDRYILRMHSGREIALRQENFYQWDGIGPAIFVPPPNKDEVWACDACTFYHDGLDAKKLTSCSVCGAPRDEKAKRDTVGRKQNVGASRVKSNIKKTNAATLSGVEDTSLSPDIKTAIDRIAKSPTHSAELETQQHAVRPEALSDSSPVVSPDRQPKTEPGGGKEKPTKHLKKCKFGKRCKHLTNGLCKFQHSCEETAAAQGREPDFKPFIGQQKAPDDVSEPERPAAAAVATAATHKVERTLMIDSGAVGRIIGYRGKTLLEIGRRSGAKVRVHHKKVDADGLVRVDLKGDTQESVDIAASMVEKKVVLNKDKPPSKVPVPSNDGNGCCVLGGNPTNGKANVPDRDATPKVEAKSRGSTTKKQGVGKKKARSGRGPVDLAAFLHSNENALKCSSITFFNWLKNNDISTVSDLAEACIDEEFVEELVSHGLKRFKLGSFEKRAAAWARAAEEAK